MEVEKLIWYKEKLSKSTGKLKKIEVENGKKKKKKTI